MRKGHRRAVFEPDITQCVNLFDTRKRGVWNAIGARVRRPQVAFAGRRSLVGMNFGLLREVSASEAVD